MTLAGLLGTRGVFSFPIPISCQCIWYTKEMAVMYRNRSAGLYVVCRDLPVKPSCVTHTRQGYVKETTSDLQTVVVGFLSAPPLSLPAQILFVRITKN